ncbi:serotransferrin-2-like [Ambystoma mexicanum]|uniref:serotransferrin-2-like n=1 Tax=Ambystoma mexicanum TaxID=8296 RepID=UPI0037E97DE4
MQYTAWMIILSCSVLLSAGKKFRWCTLSDLEQRKCSDLSRSLLAVLPAAVVNSFARVSCIRAQSTHDCINKIQANKADAVSLDAGDVFTAVKLYDLVVVAKEVYEEGSCVFAVAVARKATLTIRSLRGVRSCHNGAKWTSGWNIPLGFMLANNYIDWSEEQPLSKVLGDYFNASCIPGVGVTSPQLCALCQGQKSYVRDKNHFCETSHSEPFSGSDGAFSCLKSGAGDVAFLDHITIATASDADLAQYELLCPDGTTDSLSAYRTCNLGRGPGNAIVTRQNFLRTTRKFLTTVQHLFGRKGKARSRFGLFTSAPFGGKDLLLRDTTQHLEVIEEQEDITETFGLDYVALLKGLGHEGSSLSNSIVHWCCISDAELRKCEEWALNIKSDPLVCVQASSQAGCIEMIKNNEADAVSLDATHAYIAGRCGLVPVAAEYWGAECPSAFGSAADGADLLKATETELPPVYAVAVAKKDAKHVNIHNLGGRRSCHGHLYSPAGWLLLSRYTVGDLESESLNCDINTAYRSYFWKGCMPGAEGSLCKVCIGREEEEGAKASSRCAANHDERYYGNMGALRCLVGDAEGRSFGDVAFLEHYSLLKNIESLGRSGWLSGESISDFELLCLDGSRSPIMDWMDCNLGPVPPSMVMTRPVSTMKINDFLMKSQEALVFNPDSKFQLFQSQTYGEGDLLFKDATQCLMHTSHLSYHAILGKPFLRLAESVFNCTHSGILDFCNRDICRSSG